MEYGKFSPERKDLSEFYEIQTLDCSKQDLINALNLGSTLRWSLNRENFHIILWDAGAPFALSHREVDPDNYIKSTTGYIHKDRGVTFQDIRIFDEKEKNAIKAALKQFVGINWVKPKYSEAPKESL